MIHIIIGTKAQFIKTAPVMQLLTSRGIEYNFIDTGQHAAITKRLVTSFGVKQPDVYLHSGKEDITKLSEAISWSIKIISRAIFCKKAAFKDIFKSNKGICLIHGDTLTTLISLLLAKVAGIKVAHIEAGLRSFNILNPFPEEIIRIITMKLSNILFAPSDWAFYNLERLKCDGEKVNIGGNTVVDSIRYALSSKVEVCIPRREFVVVTIHRVETIYSKKRLNIIIKLLGRISKKFMIIFVIHKPTELQLKKNGLYEALTNENIKILPLQEYFSFLRLIKNAQFIITDGGSIQEESYYLNIPCLLMRRKTERLEGLDSNVCLSEFNEEKISSFIDNYEEYRSNNLKANNSPSEKLVDAILRVEKVSKV